MLQSNLFIYTGELSHYFATFGDLADVKVGQVSVVMAAIPWSIKKKYQWGLCAYVIVHTILPPSPVILWIELAGKPKCLPLNFGYHDVMRTCTSRPFDPEKKREIEFLRLSWDFSCAINPD